ncbi:uncharacterized protein [Halyomorpha halys]|uniref:uncharacterized protein n=1 Tax=Halyomorpha halys TaxID=286706 RepID=UPI0006D4EC5F|nr:uncharacterized protein LOC106683445 [Halyomorpha halys]
MPGIEKYNDFIFLSVPVCREVNGVYEEMSKYKDIVRKVREIEKRWCPTRPRLRVPRMTVLKQPAQLPPPPLGFREAKVTPKTVPLHITCVIATSPSQAVKEGLQVISQNRKERSRDVIPSKDWMSEFPELLEAWVKVGLKIRPISIVPMVENYVKETDWWRGVMVNCSSPVESTPRRPSSEASAWSLSLWGVLKEIDRSRGHLRDSDELNVLDFMAALVFGGRNVSNFHTGRRQSKRSVKEFVIFRGDSDFNIFSLG